MTKRPYFAALLLSSIMGLAYAGPQQEYKADTREAAARYA